MPDGERLDPFRGYNFRVIIPEFDGTIAFKSVTGLDIKKAVTEYREGTDTQTMRKIPGMNEYSDIVLERGITDSIYGYNWMQEVSSLNSDVQIPPDSEFRREVIIQLLSQRSEVVRSHVVTAAWPKELNTSDYNATENNIVIETLVLCHEGITLDTAASDIGLQG